MISSTEVLGSAPTRTAALWHLVVTPCLAMTPWYNYFRPQGTLVHPYTRAPWYILTFIRLFVTLVLLY